MGLNVSVTGSYTDSQYEGIEAAYDVARHDQTKYVGLDLSYKIKSLDLDLVGSVSFTDNKSNLEMYGYDRTQVSFTVKKSF